MTEKDIKKLKEIDSEINLLSHTSSILGWDQETYIPSGSIEERSRQLSLLSGLMHDRLTSDTVKSIFNGIQGENELSLDSLNDTDKGYVRKFYDNFRKQAALSSELVRELSRQASITQSVWIEARKTDDFKLFSGQFEKLLPLVLEKADSYGYKESPYDALLDEYEKGMTASSLDSLFTPIEKKVRDLLGEIGSAPQVDDSFLRKNYPSSLQGEAGSKLLSPMGYDMNRGRLDVSAHPFTTKLGFDDIRITTRYDENYYPSGLYSIIHEAGHALYEQGISEEFKDTCLGEGTSLGIHESQSRMWENFIGRSLPFWKYFTKHLKSVFPENLAGVSEKELFRGVNRVNPSFIRVEADEVTYNLHVILRFRIEKELIEKNISVKDLPSVWNELSRDLLGITPDCNSNGVLQDVHWSMGALGYFPTYLLGNLYCAQFYRKMESETGSLDTFIEYGDFSVILNWLRKNIHSYGSLYSPGELVEKVTGESLNSDYFISYLNNKYKKVYNF